MATILNVVFDENGYVRSYATAGTLPNGINVAIEEDIDRKDLFDTFSYYKLSNKFISVIVPKEENNEDDNQNNSKDNSTKEILVKKLVFDKLKYYDEISKTSKCDSCCLY